MSHAIISTPNPMHVTARIVSRDKFAIFDPNRQLTFSRSQPSKLNGLISCFEDRGSLSPVHSDVDWTASADVKDNLKVQDFIEIELQVRDYEVDQYGVVNNAVYSSYCQHAHHELLTNLWENSPDYGRYNPIAVTHLSFKFLAPLRV